MASYKINYLEIKNGSLKLDEDTLIFNMGTAKDCPSLLLGLCEVPAGRCYARRDEITYPAVLPYRERQANYWKYASVETLISDFTELLETKRTRLDGKLVPLKNKIKKFRFNEAGDFYTQECIEKLDKLAGYLMKKYNITTYGYTARADLKIGKRNFLIKGSSNDNGNNGRTRVIKDKSEKQAGEIVCPGSCKKCTICATAKIINVAFIIH